MNKKDMALLRDSLIQLLSGWCRREEAGGDGGTCAHEIRRPGRSEERNWPGGRRAKEGEGDMGWVRAHVQGSLRCY